MKILIAEDDPVSRAVLAKIIGADPHHQTTAAEDGEAAWALLDDPGRCFDVAFLDQRLVRAKLQQLQPVDPPYAERTLVGGF